MLTPFKLPDNGIPIKVGDSSYVYQDVYNPIEWHNGEPYRPRVEMLVLSPDGKKIFLRLYEDKHYRLPGGSIDSDSTYEQQAENETNEEALLQVKDTKFTGITYHQTMDKDFIKKGGNAPLAYVGSITYVYSSIVNGSVDKSTIEKKDLDNDMATYGEFYDLCAVANLLQRYHIEALLQNTGLWIDSCAKHMLYRELDKRHTTRNHTPMFESCEEEEGIDPYLYHGSIHHFDTFYPMSLDLGNGQQKPGWSTFCFSEYQLAKRFALMRLLQKKLEPYKDKGRNYVCNWDLWAKKPYLHKDVYEELKESLIGESFYVYTIDSTHLELGFGNDVRFPEVTFRESGVVPESIDEVVVTSDLIFQDCLLLYKMDVPTYEKELNSNLSAYHRGWLSCMLNRNYSEDSAIATLTRAVSDGKLHPGDDVEAYMKEHHITMQDISVIERLPKMANTVKETFRVSSEFEEEWVLGDNRVIVTSEKKRGMNVATSIKDMLPDLTPLEAMNPITFYNAYVYLKEDGGLRNLGLVDVTYCNMDEKDIIVRLFIEPVYRKHGVGTVLLRDTLHRIDPPTKEPSYRILMACSNRMLEKVPKLKQWGETLFGLKEVERNNQQVLFLSNAIPKTIKHNHVMEMKGFSNNDPFYFYHLVPKGANISNGIYSLQYQYDHDRYEFRKNADKYRDRLCNAWGIYLSRKPNSLTDDELLQGIIKFRDNDINGANRIYLFLYPPFTGLGSSMREILKQKDLYRIDLNNPATLQWIDSVDWGFVGSDTRNDPLSKEDYMNQNKQKYFSLYQEGSGRLLFSYMDHISVVPKQGYLPKQLWEKVPIPNTLDDIPEHGSSLLLESERPSEVNLTKFCYYHIEPDRKGFHPKTAGGWDEELYSKDIGYAIRNDCNNVKENNFTAHVFTMDDKYEVVYLGKISVRRFGENYGWEWAEQQEFDPSYVNYLVKHQKEGLVLVENASVYDVVDLTKSYDNDADDVVTEASGENADLEPIFIVCTFVGTRFGKIIQKFQHCTFSHSGIAFESGLKEIFTFSMRTESETVEWHGQQKERKKIVGGADVENVDNYVKFGEGGDCDLGVLCIFAPSEVKRIIQENIRRIFSQKEKTGYSIGNVFNIVINRSTNVENPMKMICSEFVDRMLRIANINLVDKASNLVSPNDFIQASKSNKKIFVLYNGKGSAYKKKTIDRMVRKIKSSAAFGDIGIVPPPEEKMPYVTESIVFNKDNLCYDVDKFESGESNILLVTGLSGSGKSTLANKIAKKVHAEVIHLDDFGEVFPEKYMREEVGDIIAEYMLTYNRPLFNRLKEADKINRDEKWELVTDEEYLRFFKWCIERCKKERNKKFIVEGIQIFACADVFDVKSLPIIIMGASMMTSMFQRFKRRAGGNLIDWGQVLKDDLLGLFKWYWKQEGRLQQFRKVMTEAVVLEADDDELPSLGKDDKTADYTEDAEKSNEKENTVEEPEENKEDENDEDTEGSGEDVSDMDEDAADYTDDAQTDADDEADDSTDQEELADNTGTDETDSQTTNNTIKNYQILRNFESLYRLANEISETLEPMLMEKPIQNRVLVQVRENLSAIKKAIVDYITLHFDSKKYPKNFYYYEVYFEALRKNVEILEKNQLFSKTSDKQQKTIKKNRR